MLLKGTENAFEIIATVKTLLRKTGRSKAEVAKVMTDLMAGDYENLKTVATAATYGTIKFEDRLDDENDSDAEWDEYWAECDAKNNE